MNHQCVRCKKETEWRILEEKIFSNGTKHLKGQCTVCHYTKLMPQEHPPEYYKFMFGKHKDKNITEVPFDYLKWCLEKDVVGGGMAWAIVQWLKQNNIEFKNYRN